MRAVALACLLSITACTAQPAIAKWTYTIAWDKGGDIDQYKAKYRKWSEEGAKVVIDGYCASACTLVLSTDYKLDICVTKDAQFLYHMPYLTEGEQILTGREYADYSKFMWVTEWIKKMPDQLAWELFMTEIPSVYTGSGTGDMVSMPYQHLKKYIKPCE